MDTNILYAIIAVLTAIVLGLLVFKSDWFKIKISEGKANIGGGKYASNETHISGIKNKAHVSSEQTIVEGHGSLTDISDVDDATVEHKSHKSSD